MKQVFFFEQCNCKRGLADGLLQELRLAQHLGGSSSNTLDGRGK